MERDLKVLEQVGFRQNNKLADRRKSSRFPFAQALHIAPCADGPDAGLIAHLPEMFAAQGHDISQNGIALYMSSKPTSTCYLVRIGEIPNAILILCRVVRIQEGYWQRQRQFRIGCEFIRRVPF